MRSLIHQLEHYFSVFVAFLHTRKTITNTNILQSKTNIFNKKIKENQINTNKLQ